MTSSDVLDGTSQVSAVALQLLLQETVPLSIRVAHKLGHQQKSATELEETTIDKPLLDAVPDDLPGTVGIYDAPELGSDEVLVRLELYGYQVGLLLAEVLLYKNNHIAHTTTKIDDILDIMKFVCRDVWKTVYGKQMDNLRTNHRGTFVLVDTLHRLIQGMNLPKGIHDTTTKAETYLWFPCGLIRGVLTSFSIEATVTAEITQFPAVTFNILTLINN